MSEGAREKEVDGTTIPDVAHTPQSDSLSALQALHWSAGRQRQHQQQGEKSNLAAQLEQVYNRSGWLFGDTMSQPQFKPALVCSARLQEGPNDSLLQIQ
ncbi:hypothetical protein EYF80_018216 [Liparis tanakae]|uniref:Uncharacterized protein n=1 Tax=Liparis tanakae TaxID=230148 RepID=A0A4Z2I151_9TELE|nr:hypothetical protein EYF80_018216 [Liparis tanakae]